MRRLLLLLVPAAVLGTILVAPLCAQQPAPQTTAPLSAYALREKGIRAAGDGIYDAAVRFFLQYREATGKKEPDFADATVLIVKSLLSEQPPQAVGAQEALDYHKKHSVGLSDEYYLEALGYWRGRVKLAQGEWAAAAAIAAPLADSGKTVGHRIKALELLGDAYVKLQNWPLAEEALNRLLAESPETDLSGRARLGLVKTYLASDRPLLAKQLLDSIQQQPSEIPLRLIEGYRVLVALRQGDLDGAMIKYESVAPQRPQGENLDWWTVASELGRSLMQADRFEEALRVLPHAEGAAVRREDVMEAALRFAECLIALERHELAMSALSEFKMTYPESVQVVPVQLRLAELLRRTGTPLQAAELFAEIASNEGVAPEARYRAAFSRGWSLREARQLAGATQGFLMAAKLGQNTPQVAEAYMLAGDCAFQMADYTKAAIFYQTVADNYPATNFAEFARFKQAGARARAKLYANAAVVYQQFLADFPKSSRVPEARLERGIALKNAGDTALAAQELSAFVAKFPTSPHAARALLTAYQAAMVDDDVPRGMAFLSQLLKDYPESELCPQALYQRAHLQFFSGEDQAAVADSTLFLERYPKLPLAADVLIWLGDYYANRGDASRSEGYFLRLVTSLPASPHAPAALYEAAKSMFQRGELEKSELLLQQLGRDYPGMPARIAGQASMLAGDILAKQGKYADALPYFEKVRELVTDSALSDAALGRLGEMHYSLAADAPDELELALSCFDGLVERDGVAAATREMALYRRGKVFEKLGRSDSAIKDYLDIVYQYDLELKAGKTRDWYYFARAGYDAARLLVMAERYREAARTYERMHRAKIPTAADALERAREIRRAKGLQD